MPGIGREHTLEPFVRLARTVGDDDHAGVQRVADADAAAVVSDTHVAPAAVLSSAFSTGQSAIASLPSRMPSVSRFGDATDPVSSDRARSRSAP
jgi:hypothetical protein